MKECTVGSFNSKKTYINSFYPSLDCFDQHAKFLAT